MDSAPTPAPHRTPAGPGRHESGDAAASVSDAARALRRARLAALADDPLARPPVVDGYQVGRLLGTGGSSAVWAGTGPDGVERALKVLHPTGADADLARELALLRRVRHPRLVAVHDIARDTSGAGVVDGSAVGPGRPVLVLQLAAGGSLADVVRARGRLTPGEVSGLLGVLGPALEDLHAAGVVHGDVAPGNVLLDAAGAPLLADLGVARALGRRPGSVLGTPGFADPAALAGEDVGAASDVHGLAALAWFALTGAPPQGAGRLAVRRAAADLGPAGGADLLAVLREGLHRRPAQRPTPGELGERALACARPRPVRRPGTRPTTSVVRAAAPPAHGAAAAPAPVTRPAPAARRPVRAPDEPSHDVPGRRTRPARRGPRPRLLVAGGAGALLLAAAGAALAVTGGPGAETPAGRAPAPTSVAPVPAGTAPAPAPTPSAPPVVAGDDVLRGEDLAAVVAELADRRAAALVSGDPAALDLVDAPGSAALAADTELLAGTARDGLAYADLAFTVTAVTVQERGPERAVVTADVVTGAHAVVAADGGRTPVAAGQPRTSRLTLLRTGEGWRVAATG